MRGFVIKAGVCVFALFLTVACGRKGDPRPPETKAPSQVQYLTLAGEVKGVKLSWMSPVTDASGDPLIDLAEFRIKRAVVESDSKPKFVVIAEIEVPESEEAAPSSKQGSNFTYLDEDVAPGKRYEYLVFPVNKDGVAGVAPEAFRVKFAGESSLIERVSSKQ